MRTIKSQDDKVIVNAKKVLGVIISEYAKEWTIGAFDTWEGECTGFLGKYSTEKRALQVLEKLNEWLNVLQPEIDNTAKNITNILTELQADMDVDDILKMLKLGDISRCGELVNTLVISLKKMQCFCMPQDSEELDA